MASRLAQLAPLHAHAYRSVKGLHRLRFAADVKKQTAAASLAKDSDVESVEPSYVVSADVVPNDPEFPKQWSLNNTGQMIPEDTILPDISALDAWELGTGDSSIIIAVIDTGVDYTHEDLAANIFRNEAECTADGIDNDGDGYVDDCHGIDPANGDSDPMDDEDHGTHVAGILGAVGDNAIGIAGVAWHVSILPCKFLDASGYGSIADAIVCLDYIADLRDRGMNIVASNNSWGGLVISRALEDAIRA